MASEKNLMAERMKDIQNRPKKSIAINSEEFNPPAPVATGKASKSRAEKRRTISIYESDYEKLRTAAFKKHTTITSVISHLLKDAQL